MSILIKGMEMPTSCFYCPFRRKVDPENIRCIVTRELFEETFAGTIETRNRGNCPLVPVPPHGDLIDRMALVNDKYAIFTIEGEGLWGMYRDKGVWLSAIETAPAIIPADKEGEE